MRMRPSSQASYPTSILHRAANLAIFGRRRPTLAALGRTDWLTNHPRSAKDDQRTRQLQADAQAKRSGIAPGRIMGEPEQARSRRHDQGADRCVEADEETEGVRRELMLDNQRWQRNDVPN
jgi:hypothetical protein